MSLATLREAYSHSFSDREQLVKQLHEEKKTLHSEDVKLAFLAIPREAFVPFFFSDEQTQPGEKWRKVDSSDPTYVSQIYQDQSLVTQVDTYGVPISSSSMPSVMACMIEALQVRKHHAVLEIGTGTGYNATLLACIAGACTTIDVEPSCVDHLQAIIQKFQLHHLFTTCVNGLQGYSTNGPYDRILVTASAPTIPFTWIEQLTSHGRLVCDFAGGMEHAFLIIDKNKDGITGHIQPEQLWFMPLYGEHIPDLLRVRSPVYPMIFNSYDDEAIALFIEALQENRSFRFFLQTALPGIKLQRMEKQTQKIYRLILPDSKGYVTFIQQESSALWSASLHAESSNHTPTHQFLTLYQQWKRIGEPRVEDYRVCLFQGKPAFQIGELVFPMLSL